MRFDNSYARLPDRFFERTRPTPVADPQLRLLNEDLAQELGASGDLTQILAGNHVPDGADPLAMAYAGHQFGGWVPQLGDGRAVLLGEVIGVSGTRWDLQLKGSGPTRFSRRGDGRAWLGPVLREYIVSEAMAALTIPTTRALAVVTTGETVRRERALPGAVLTRVATSHIRVGTFQYFAARQDTAALEALTDHVIARHYPDATDVWDLLDRVIVAQAHLIARWMGVGFIHGVMNTDNCHVGGLTIDYGPCAFMDRYHLATVYSSIDHQGRYAYGQQPNMAAWNLAQLASALLPLMGPRDAAIERATQAVDGFADHFGAAWMAEFRAKLGLVGEDDADLPLIEDFLRLMAADGVDFTLAFRGLADGRAEALFTDTEGFAAWHRRWLDRGPQDADVLNGKNPAMIPRNHLIERAIQAALNEDYTPAKDLIAALATPFQPPESAELMQPPAPGDEVRATFCGT